MRPAHRAAPIDAQTIPLRPDPVEQPISRALTHVRPQTSMSVRTLSLHLKPSFFARRALTVCLDQIAHFTFPSRIGLVDRC